MYDKQCDAPCLDAPHSQEIREAWLEVQNATLRADDWPFDSTDQDVALLAVALFYCQELCVCDMVWLTAQSHEHVTHKLQMLRSEALVGSRREGGHVRYHLTDEGHSLLHSPLDAGARASR